MATVNKGKGLPYQGGQPGAIADDAVFQTLLGALQGAFKRALGLESVLFSMNDNYKARILNDNSIKFPRATIRITNIELLRNLNNYSLGRRGIVALPKEPVPTTATPKDKPLKGSEQVSVLNFMQAKGSFELHVFDTDRRRSMAMSNHLAMLIGSSRMSISVVIDDNFEYYISPDFDTNIPVPDQVLSDQNDKGVMDLVLPFTAQGYVGRVDKAARVLQVKYGYHSLDEYDPNADVVDYDKDRSEP